VRERERERARERERERERGGREARARTCDGPVASRPRHRELSRVTRHAPVKRNISAKGGVPVTRKGRPRPRARPCPAGVEPL
jgi:hypothetical protein